MATLADLKATPGVHPTRDPATSGYVFNHTMLRVKDAAKSLDFYTRVLGFRLAGKLSFPDRAFDLMFLHMGTSPLASAEDDRLEALFGAPGVLELTFNHGTDVDDSFGGYANGNSDPGRGFGHICVSVPDIAAACARFAKLGVKFVKKLNEGSMPDIAFIADPDGYWIEIVQPSLMRSFAADLPTADGAA